MVSPALVREMSLLAGAITPAAARATMQLLAPCHDMTPPAGMVLMRNLAYGTHPRQVLDVFRPAAEHTAQPVLVFVHGGGFVGGDKCEFGPFYDNIGLWAARQGLTGVNINYRLAPDHPWPAASDDLQSALQWLARHASPVPQPLRPIVLMGHSAGASHVAAWVARHGAHAAALGVAGVVLVSGLYDLDAAAPTPGRAAYFGADAAKRASRSPLIGLSQAGLPMLLAHAEFDPPENHDQTFRLATACADTPSGRPLVVDAAGHNHFSTVLQLGAFETGWSAALRDFALDRSVTPRRPA